MFYSFFEYCKNFVLFKVDGKNAVKIDIYYFLTFVIVILLLLCYLMSKLKSKLD